MTQPELLGLSGLLASPSPVDPGAGAGRLPVDGIATVTPLRPLNEQTLGLHGAKLVVPTYDRTALTPAVVHLSVGGFGRAHQLLYLDELAERRLSSDWGVVGVGLHRWHMKAPLAPQDYLYTVVERDSDGERARVVGVLLDYHFAPDDPAAVLDALTDPRTRLVTLTITTAGYCLDPTTGEFDPSDPDLLADLHRSGRPTTVFGFLVEALDRRRRAGTPPFTVVSCDNMRRNGDAARDAVAGFARLRDEVLARWITDRVAFPSSMVDRITPQTHPAERAAVAERYGVDDRWPVITEPFSQWVIEDSFCNGRPPLEQVGVRFVDDVTDYELMKTRLLNATHSALGYLGTPAGHTRIDELIAEPLFCEYATRLMDDEVSPMLPEPAGIDLIDYKRTLLRRFANPAIADRLARLCRRGSTKLPQHLLPSLRDALQAGLPHRLLTLAVAGWFTYLRGHDVDDPHAERLQALARAGSCDPRPLLGERWIFGDLGAVPGFVADLERVMHQLACDGVPNTVTRSLAAAPRTVGEEIAR